VLSCARPGTTNLGVAAELGVNPATSASGAPGTWPKRLKGLSDEDRPGAPRRITDDKIEKLIVKTLEESPVDATHWSTRSMAKATGMSQTRSASSGGRSGCSRTGRTVSSWSTDPFFIDKVRDVVGLYLDPPERAVVLCVDEKSQIQALNRFSPVLPMIAGHPRTTQPRLPTPWDHEPVRRIGHGIGQGDRLAAPTSPAAEFKKFLIRIDQEVPDGLDVHLILDNYGTHKTPTFTGGYSDTRGSTCISRQHRARAQHVERWFGELTTKKIKRGAHTNVPNLEKDIREWIALWNENPRPYVWVKTADQILESLARYCERISAAAAPS